MSEPIQVTDPVGGYILGFGENFDNSANARPLDFSKIELDKNRLKYFQRYLDDYYNVEFIYEQGTEQIIEMAARYAPGGHWLDIGSGTSALFWATAFRNILSVNCVDLVPEALSIFDRFRNSDALPKCYLEALKIAGNSIEVLKQTRTAPWHFHQCNILKPWASYLGSMTFNMITAYAVFGLSKDIQAYEACFKYLAEAASSKQTLLGADWIRSGNYVALEGHDNRYVSAKACYRAAKRAGFNVIECEYYEIKGDPLYSGVVSWVLRPGTSSP